MNDRSELFRRLYTECRRDLYVYIVRSVGDEELALDILQDSIVNFMKAFEKRELPESIRSRIYLFKIARNLIINYYKNPARRRLFYISDEDIQRIPDHALNPENRYLKESEIEEARKVISETLSSMHEAERTAIILRHIQGMKLEDIASVLEVSTATAHRILSKGMKTLIRESNKKGIDL
jgi:RNA polymerase sigma-70 factor (ECF subfamily)